MTMHNIILIGCGRMGSMHLELLRRYFPNVSVQAIVDDALAAQKKHLGIPVYESSQLATLDNTLDYDAAIIAASSDQHLGLIETLLDQDKAIFCEKPVSFDIAALVHLEQRVQQRRIKFQVGLNRRFDNDFMRLKEQIGTLLNGEVHILKITNRDPYRPDLSFVKNSGGMFFDFNIHDFDMAHFLTGASVEEIYLQGGALIDPQLKAFDDLDTVIMSLVMSNGCLVIIDASRETHIGYDQRIEAFGRNGALLVKNHQKHSVTEFNPSGTHQGSWHENFSMRYKQAYINQFKAFFEYCTGGHHAQAAVGVTEIRRAVEVAHMAKTAYVKQKPIARVDEILSAS